MEIGGLKQMYLFPDMLKAGKTYYGELTGIKHTTSKAGKPLSFAVFVTSLEDELPCEYLVSTWNICSDKPFDSESAKAFDIKRHGTKVWFEPVETQSTTK